MSLREGESQQRKAVKGIASIVQGVAGFLLTAPIPFYLFFSGGTLDSLAAAFLSIPVSVASVILIVGVLLKFRMWMPAMVGGGLGLFVATAAAILFLIFYIFVSLFFSFLGGG